MKGYKTGEILREKLVTQQSDQDNSLISII